MTGFLVAMAERLLDEVGEAVRDQLLYILRCLGIYHVSSREPMKVLSIDGIWWELFRKSTPISSVADE